MIADPWFYLVASVAITVLGLSKSGFLTGLGMLGVPIMALVIPPVQAAAILLPVLLTMDVYGVWAYRRCYDAANLRILVPSGLAGIGVGWLTAAQVTDDHIRLMVGAIGLVFGLWQMVRFRPERVWSHSRLAGGLCGALSGFTSFVSHAGSPPFQVYLLPQRLSPLLYAGTSTMFFAAVNAAKIVPYAMLGQLDAGNLATSLVLLPLAPISFWAGLRVLSRIPQEPFYRIAYGLLLAVSAKLLWDGIAALTT